jgi:hypothetical protein
VCPYLARCGVGFDVGALGADLVFFDVDDEFVEERGD